MQDFFILNYKTLLREILKDLKKWRDIYYVHGLILNTVKMSNLPQLVYSHKNPIIIQTGYFFIFTNLDNLKNLHGKAKDLEDSKEKQSWGTHTTWF